MSKCKVIYIDEDPDDILYFQEFMDGHFDVETITIENGSKLDDVVDEILNSPPDAVVTDFMLNEKATVGFNGQTLIELLQERNKHLPCFLLTSHAPDALDATHDARLVQTKAVILGSDDLKSLFRKQISKVIESHKVKLKKAEDEYYELISYPPSTLTAHQRKRVIELDGYLEEHGMSSDTIPDEIKDERSIELLTALINQVDAMLKKSGEQ